MYDVYVIISPTDDQYRKSSRKLISKLLTTSVKQQGARTATVMLAIVSLLDIPPQGHSTIVPTVVTCRFRFTTIRLLSVIELLNRMKLEYTHGFG